MIGELFGASLLIVLGLSILLGVLFGIRIPAFRILVGLFLVYLGIQYVTGWPGKKKDGAKSICFGKQSLVLDAQSIEKTDGQADYTVLFGSGKIDLSNIDRNIEVDDTLKVNINTVFGETQIAINKAVPVVITSRTSFGKTLFPDDTNINFGNYTYRSHKVDRPAIHLHTNTVFGRLIVKNE